MVGRIISDRFLIYAGVQNIDIMSTFCQNLSFVAETTLSCKLSMSYAFFQKDYDIDRLVYSLETDLKHALKQDKLISMKIY